MLPGVKFMICISCALIVLIIYVEKEALIYSVLFSSYSKLPYLALLGYTVFP